MSGLAALKALLLSGDAYNTLHANRELLFAQIPELRGMVGFAQNNPYHSRDLWDHTIYAVAQLPPDFTLRMAMLLHDLGKLFTRSTDEEGIDHFFGHPQISVEQGAIILRRLGVEEDVQAEILTLIKLHDMELPTQPNKLRQWVTHYGVSLLMKLLQVKRADALAQSPEKLASRITELNQFRRQIACLAFENAREPLP